MMMTGLIWPLGLLENIFFPGMQQMSFGFPRHPSSKATRLGKMNISQRTPGKNSVLHKSNKHFRYENILFKGENVLTPKTLQQVGPTEFFWGEPLKLSTIVPDVPGARRDVDLSN